MSRTAVLVVLLAATPAGAADPPDFERHVAPILDRAGCAAGACHGSFRGKGGLRLSLFGADRSGDYLALTRGGGGRRVDTVAPDQSLVLLKATGQVSHAGGRRFGIDSREAVVLRDWIAGGAMHTPGSGTVARLEVRPAERVLTAVGDTARVGVWATFADGTTAEVTAFTDLRAKDESIAEVSANGVVTAIRTGDTALVTGYGGRAASGRIFVPRPGSGVPHTEPPAANVVDRHVLAKLERLNITPSGSADDAEFLRRVTIDTTAGLPTSDEVRAFVADTDPGKREKLVDRLLSHPRHAALWATKMCDITGCDVGAMDGPDEGRTRKAGLWHDWFRRRFADNVPYDRTVRGVLTATSRDGLALREWITIEAVRERGDGPAGYADRDTLDLFWRRFEGDEYFPLESMAERTSTAFLGLWLECARCHRHPFDRWTQADFRAYANTFGRVRFDSSPGLTAAVVDLLDERRKRPAGLAGPSIPRLQEVYIAADPRALPHPDTGDVLPARAPGGPALAGPDPRVTLADWVATPDNPYFARAFANRVWAHYFGIGLVNPVDDLSAANPASNEPLLAALAAGFVRTGFDVRRLERTILLSRTYQRSSTPNDTNRADRSNFSRSYPRSLMAEAVLDVLNDALGSAEEFGSDAPAGARAIEVATNRVSSPYAARLFRVFGRPSRTTTCDCERPSGPSLPQALFLMTDEALLEKLNTGRLARLVASDRSDSEIVDELFLSSLSRWPTAAEKSAALGRVSATADRGVGLADLLWALINTREFVVNH